MCCAAQAFRALYASASLILSFPEVLTHLTAQRNVSMLVDLDFRTSSSGDSSARTPPVAAAADMMAIYNSGVRARMTLFSGEMAPFNTLASDPEIAVVETR